MSPMGTGPGRRRGGAARLRTAAAALCAAVALPLLAPVPAYADEWRDKQYWLADYGVIDAWKTTKGAGVKVAVIDTGVDASHPDLAGAVTGGVDVSGAGDPKGAKGLGGTPEHGTLVATLLAGRGHEKPNDDKGDKGAREDKPAEDKPADRPDGIIGVAPEAEILAVSTWIGGTNPGGVPIDQQIPNAVRWAVNNGAKVINMSLGSTSTAWPESWDDAFLYAEQNDVVIVAAAGNREGGMVQVGAPATIPGVLTVAGLNRQGEASWDSSSEGISIGVAAPSEKLVGGLPEGTSRYAGWEGTSGAAPLVSGVAALIRSAHPEMSAAEVVNRIVRTARDAGAPGVDTIYGYGILDANAAVNADVPSVTSNPLGTIAEWIRVHRRVADVSPGAADIPAPTVPDLPEPAVPVAQEPAAEKDNLPAVVVLGFSALLVLVLVGGTVHVSRVRRRGTAAGNPENTSTGSLDEAGVR
ncbi:S8 family serine peptidase [Arthrobacter sp. zg-Y877]|uniref:S8 family serine peptidase n=1 Tax=Arthrobacter sp. zg-Y877 TaxID=3049074 RepID=UPI0025A4BCC0|nr:S8 family serine peptidase [Arthrobacter sp. zg-Y877]MDM7990560.1 S8 family serine peptidase [Arthrobacter sp. zg-Y877]